METLKKPIGPLLHSYLVDHLGAVHGLRVSSIRSYRDGLRLFLLFAARDARRGVSRLTMGDLTFERVQQFLRSLENQRKNHIRTRNHRLAVLHSFFDYLATRMPEMVAVSQRVAAIPAKRVAPPETRFLERDEVHDLLGRLPADGRLAARDRALLLFLYNTGARAQEVADLRIENLDLNSSPRVRLFGKGGKWRACPLWKETANQLRALIDGRGDLPPDAPLFASSKGKSLTRFGIYKLVRKHGQWLEMRPKPRSKRLTPHVFRHTAAVHLLEAGVEVNVIRSWLGHVSLATTNRYAEITTPMKEAALRACEPPLKSSVGLPKKPIWHDDRALLAWLESL